jgi:hypothetical protein
MKSSRQLAVDEGIAREMIIDSNVIDSTLEPNLLKEKGCKPIS